jgi:hypothetical protein
MNKRLCSGYDLDDSLFRQTLFWAEAEKPGVARRMSGSGTTENAKSKDMAKGREVFYPQTRLRRGYGAASFR